MCTWTSFLPSNWHARISVKHLVIAAVSARPFVRAAVAAGFKVVVADAFCDTDTIRGTVAAIRLPYASGAFDARAMRERLFPLLTPETGFVYGSGFETQPDLLQEIGERCQLYGNTPETVRSIKDPGRFFSVLTHLGITFPHVTFRQPACLEGWLSKRAGGSGGVHVAPANALRPADYWQRYVPGEPYSLFFLADGEEAFVVGFNRQWTAPTAEAPYRYGGAVSRADLPDDLREAMLQAARALTRAFGLRGLNSLDCLVAEDRVMVLEVNPRLGATFGLYDLESEGAALMRAHLTSCPNALVTLQQQEGAAAHLIYYAPFPLILPENMAWPDWVADLPAGGQRIGRDEPLCTVTAKGRHAAEAERRVRTRADALARYIHPFCENIHESK